MNGDLDVIIRTFPKSWDKVHLYAIGDIHVGAPNFDEESIRKKIKIIQEDPVGVVTLCGDLADYGLKNSKTNVFQAMLQPAEQMDYVHDLLLPIKDKIVSCVPGNHEERLTRESGVDPMLTICCRLGIEDRYRENVAIVKLCFGTRAGKTTVKQPNTFMIMTTHGTSKGKNHRFNLCFEGLDACVSGHVHQPSYSPHGKIRVNANSGTAKHVAYKEIVVDANLKPGSYALKKEYEIAPPPEIQYLEMYIKRGPAPQREEQKIINYHAIQL